MTSVVFQVRIQTGDAEINPLHLSEEIQAYLNAHDDEAEVVGYKLKCDDFVPFYAKEEY
jgi:hypothetical protein